MKTKKLSLAMLFLAITIIAYIVATVLFCYTTKPKVLTGEFPFSITYEYKGEQKNLSGVLKSKFSGSETVFAKDNVEKLKTVIMTGNVLYSEGTVFKL